jgi:hypothetical protein
VWPAELVRYLSERYGQPSAIEPLGGGQSGATVERVRFASGSVVVKGPAERRELHVYRALRSRFEAAGVRLPGLEWSSDNGWLVLEDLPAVLPVQDALGHPRVVGVLRRLHSELKDVDLEDPFVSTWPPELTERALAAFRVSTASGLEPRLMELRDHALPLFDGQCVISGDPNPTNWGLRENGELVLFDWGRIGRGEPAIDLAITVPGLGNRADYARLASVYLGDETGSGVDALAAEIAVAKVWTVVHYLAEAGAGHIPNAAAAIERLEAAVPAWLADL